jgi:phospholipid/cholesterol/gamma-HCH transport system substrate-binding protein
MITRATQAKVIAFVLIALAVLGYIAVRYASVGRYVGVRSYYTVKVDLSDAGGIFPNANVTYRGVSVGRVGTVSLTSTGVQADLNISDSAPKIPANVQAVVADLSAVGEEYVDLRPQTRGGPYLTANQVIPQAETQIPQPVTQLLTSIDNLANSLPAGSLRTVVNELGNAFSNQGPNMQVLLDSSYQLTRTSLAAEPQSTQLINDGRAVLATQQDESSAIKSWSSSMEQFAQQLASSDSDLRRLITAAPQASEQVTGLLKDNDPSLGIVFANLLTTSDLELTRQNGLEEVLSILPADIAAGSTAITTNGANFGVALDFFDPLPCTSGYSGTTYRNGTNTAPTSKLNTGASCTEPASTGIDVRGSAHAPPGGPPPPAALPGGAPAPAVTPNLPTGGQSPGASSPSPSPPRTGFPPPHGTTSASPSPSTTVAVPPPHPPGSHQPILLYGLGILAVLIAGGAWGVWWVRNRA